MERQIQRPHRNTKACAHKKKAGGSSGFNNQNIGSISYCSAWNSSIKYLTSPQVLMAISGGKRAPKTNCTYFKMSKIRIFVNTVLSMLRPLFLHLEMPIKCYDTWFHTWSELLGPKLLYSMVFRKVSRISSKLYGYCLRLKMQQPN